jgi:protein CpxP
MSRLIKAAMIAIALAGLAGAPIAFAQNETPTKPATKPDAMQDMMQGGDMGMMGMMTQMSQMMETCNKMMQSAMPNMEKPTEDGKKPNNG